MIFSKPYIQGKPPQSSIHTQLTVTSCNIATIKDLQSYLTGLRLIFIFLLQIVAKAYKTAYERLLIYLV